MTVFLMFFVELMAMRFATFSHDHSHPHSHDDEQPASSPITVGRQGSHSVHLASPTSHTPGDDHLGHSREHTDNDSTNPPDHEPRVVEDYSAQLTAIFILEFGVIFHSVFIGLTLAVAGEEFNTLYVVLVFHQTFEGLAIGSRLATIPWPKTKRWTPYVLGAAYGVSTPSAIAVGLGVRTTWAPGSQVALITNGVFDSVSAGILIYTGLVELMAHEFMFSATMRRAKLRVMLSAFGLMCLGAGLMALLGKWA